MEPDRPFPGNESQGLLCVALHMNSLESYRMMQERLTKLSGPGDGKIDDEKIEHLSFDRVSGDTGWSSATACSVQYLLSCWQRILKKKIKQNLLSDIILL